MVNLLVKLQHWISISVKVSLISLARHKPDQAVDQMLLRLLCNPFALSEMTAKPFSQVER